MDRYFESLRLERFHSGELGLKFSGVIDVSSYEVHLSVSDALELYIRLKGAGADSFSVVFFLGESAIIKFYQR